MKVKLEKYQGEKSGADPKKKPFKMFDVEAFIAPSHPKYQEYMEAANDNEEPKVQVKLNLQILMIGKLRILLRTMRTFINQITMEMNQNHRILSIWPSQIQICQMLSCPG